MELERMETSTGVVGNSNQQSEASATKLQKRLGLMDGVGIIVGVIVGSGIFVSPKGVLLNAGSIGLALIVWALSGLLSLVGALCYADLGTMIPKSGGDYAYIMEAFGPIPAFLYLWSSLLVIMPTGNAITALTFSNYVLDPFYPECDPPDDAVRLLAAALICLITAINCGPVGWMTRIQNGFTLSKVLALVVVITAGVVHLSLGHTEKLQQPFQDSTTSPGKIVLAFYSGLFSFAGWNYLNFVTEEIKEPEKNLPRAIVISLSLVTGVYLLTNFAYFSVLSNTEILASNAVAVTFGNRLLGVMRWIIPVFVATSTFGAVNGGVFTSSRLFFVGARYGHMPRLMAFLNLHYLTPVPCLLVLGAITLAILTTSNVLILINFTSFVESVFTAMSVAGLLYIRWKKPEIHRPIQVHVSLPIIFFLLYVCLVCLPIYSEPYVVGIGVVIILSGLPVYFLCIHLKKRPLWLQTAFRIIEVTVQKVCMAVPEQIE